jgi:aryl-alcohol dehydrogenase (NADP+)
MLLKFFRRAKSSIKVQAMKYRSLGRSGLKVSSICLGTMSFGTAEWEAWTIPEQDSRPIIHRALELGLNFFDTADVYSNGVSEEILGRALRDFARRDQVIIATKVNGPMGSGPNDRGLSRIHIMAAVNASLRRLKTDYIDLYQIHRWDYETPIEETLSALDDLVRSGKVRYLGASSMFAWEFSKALHTAEVGHWTRFVSMQNHYNLIYREEEREMLPLCRDQGIAVLPWSPLARGLLTGSGKGRNTIRAKTDECSDRLYDQDCDSKIVARTAEVAAKRGLKPAQVAMAWLRSKAEVTAPVLGVTRMQHLEEAVASLGVDLEMSEIQALEECYKPHPVRGHP